MIKYCYKCQQSKLLNEFTKNKSKKDGLSTECKPCKRMADKDYFKRNAVKIKNMVAIYRNLNKEKANQSIKKSKAKKQEKYKAIKAKYKSIKLNAIPKWADLEKISCLYSVAAMLNKYGNQKYHVDHIIPLKNKNVCGLHTYENLRVISALENLKKGNKFFI
jgi:hypothetical protein